MKWQTKMNKRTLNNRLAHSGQLFLTLLFFFSVIFSTASADPGQPVTPGSEGLPVLSAEAQESPESPTANATLASSVFGVEMTPVSIAGGLSKMNSSYTRWVRGPEIIWKDVQPTDRNTYDWTKISSAVTEIKNAYNVNPGSTQVIVVVRGTPAWAQNNSPYSCGPVKQSEFSAFASFMFNLITVLESPTYSVNMAYVKHWEIWNEPDIAPVGPSDPDQPWGGCWGDPTDPYYGGRYYGEFLKAIYGTIKTKDPNAQLMIGGLNLDCDPRVDPPAGKTCTPSKFLEGILVAGAGNSFDGVAFHAFDYALKDTSNNYLLGQYNNPNWPGAAWNESGPALVQKARFIRQVLAQYGVTGKFLMNTENSLLDDPYATINRPYPTTLEASKSYYVAQAYAAAYAEGLRANIWFDVAGSWQRNNGLVKMDGQTSLDAYDAYLFPAGNSGDSYLVQEFRYLNPLSFPGITGYEFGIIPTTNPGASAYPYHIWLLWSKDGGIHSLTLPAESPAVFNVKGQQIFANITAISITPQPYYIIMQPVLTRSRLPFINRGTANGNFESGFTNWTQVGGPAPGGAPTASLPTSLQTTNPVNPTDATLKTLDTSVPLQSTSAVIGNPTLGHGQSKGVCSFPNVPIAYGGLERYMYVPQATAGKTVNLDFDYILYSQDTSSNSFDQFEVWVTPFNPADFTPLAPPAQVFVDGNKSFVSADQCRWYRIPGPENVRSSKTSGWAPGSVDISAYQGTILLVSFRVYNRQDGWLNTYAFLDSVQIKVR